MKILSNELAQHYQITSLQRGSCPFSSFIAKNGKILFLDSHLERLLLGAHFLFPYSGWLTCHEKLKEYVESELAKLSLEIQDERYFRLTIFDEYLYLQNRELTLSSLTVKMTTALKIKTPGPLPSFVKLSNYVESDLELKNAKNKNFDEVIFFDNFQNVTEASTSNVFIVTTDGHILTPPPSSMILDGITRKKLILKLRENNYLVQEIMISKIELQKAREIWLTNSVKGMRFVASFETIIFKKEASLFNKVINFFGRFGELHE
jgi:branched-subunit amino acid aminotransferase/4-amino-4-deoxychorismate lyase